MPLFLPKVEPEASIAAPQVRIGKSVLLYTVVLAVIVNPNSEFALIW